MKCIDYLTPQMCFVAKICHFLSLALFPQGILPLLVFVFSTAGMCVMQAKTNIGRIYCVNTAKLRKWHIVAMKVTNDLPCIKTDIFHMCTLKFASTVLLGHSQLC